MTKTYPRQAVLIVAMLASIACTAEAQTPAQREHFNYGSWEQQAAFSQGVSVPNPGRIIFLSGVGAEEDDLRGAVHYPGDFLAQCRYAYGEIKKRLEKQGATMADIVHTVTYTTDVRNVIANRNCRVEAFGKNGPFPAQTFIVVSALARPGMLVEIEARAVTSR